MNDLLDESYNFYDDEHIAILRAAVKHSSAHSNVLKNYSALVVLPKMPYLGCSEAPVDRTKSRIVELLRKPKNYVS